MTAWLVLLSLAVIMLVLSHASRTRREDRRDKRWEEKIDGLVTGFAQMEHKVTGAIRNRTDLENRIKRLEDKAKEYAA